MVLISLAAGALLFFISFVDAALHNVLPCRRTGVPQIPVSERSVTSLNGTALPPITTVYYFDQLIDHNDPSLGTFQQRYWMNWEFYKPSGPIILMSPGETNADGWEIYITNGSMNGMIAQQQHGANIILEHRFFGYSNPYPNLTSQSLELLTIQQAIDDLVYFAENANLPMPGGDNVKPNTTKWVLMGRSYAGALTSWTMATKPGIFHAAYASSAVVEAITDFYGYFTPIREYMPQNCSADIQAVIAYLDEMFAQNDTVALQNLKSTFGLSNLTHLDDFASALTINLGDWQSLNPDVGPGAMFFQFCDALEVKDGVSAPASGWGLENAVLSWGSFWNNTYYSYVCGNLDAESCLGTYNTSSPVWTNVGVNNAYRSWSWMVCNQVGWYQVGPPVGQPAIVSRILEPIYDERQCVNMFPDKFSSPPSPSVDEVNRMYHGWNLTADRLFLATGLRDPWREATMSADGLNKPNTSTQPIYESDGFHASDMLAANGVVDPTVYAVQMAGLRYMKAWLG